MFVELFKTRPETSIIFKAFHQKIFTRDLICIGWGRWWESPSPLFRWKHDSHTTVDTQKGDRGICIQFENYLPPPLCPPAQISFLCLICAGMGREWSVSLLSASLSTHLRSLISFNNEGDKYQGLCLTIKLTQMMVSHFK